MRVCSLSSEDRGCFFDFFFGINVLIWIFCNPWYPRSFCQQRFTMFIDPGSLPGMTKDCIQNIWIKYVSKEGYQLSSILRYKFASTFAKASVDGLRIHSGRTGDNEGFIIRLAFRIIEFALKTTAQSQGSLSEYY
jgi:hypothetical protein